MSAIRPARRCAFCDRTDLSKEHFGPKWMRPYFALPFDPVRTSWSQIRTEGGRLKSHREKTRPGHVVATKFRVVCSACNNGWMSELEERAKPILMRILANETFDLTTEDQCLLARWIALKTIVGESEDSIAKVTPRDSRCEFRTSDSVPEIFRIYLGHHSVPARSGYSNYATRLMAFSEEPIKLTEKLGPRNTQQSVFLVGPLLAFVCATTTTVDIAHELNLPSSLKQIWPQTQSVLPWPTAPTIPADGVRALERALHTWLQGPNTLWRQETFD